MKHLLYSIIIFLIFAASAESQPIEITPVDYNTSSDDFNSYLLNKDRTIYFTSDRSGGKQKVFVIEPRSSGMRIPAEVKGDINDGSESGAVSLTSDGQFMLFSAYQHDKGGLGRTDIYSAEKINGEWTNIKNLGPNVNSEAWDSQPMISNDGTMLFFTSDRSGGFGGTDIYMSYRTGDGWSKAENIGRNINTQYDDMTPVIGIDNSSFTFSSNRPGGRGMFDIYISKYKANSFSTPVNAGEPINSSADEYYYYSMPNSNEAYFSSSRSGGTGNLDIYKAVPNPYESDAVFMLNGIVMDSKNKTPLGANIIITDLATGQKVADLRSDDKTGEYTVVLQQNRTYSITAEKDDYLFFSERYEVPASAKGRDYTKDILLSPIAGGNTRLLIFFDFDKSVLKNESYPELERVAGFLNKNKTVKIVLEGHTDDVGDANYNDKLSESRTKSVKDYLISRKIDGNRIKTIGYGLRKPLVNDKTDEARATNRRVEMKIQE